MANLTRIFFTVAQDQADALSAFLATRVAHGWEERVTPEGAAQATVHLTVPEAAQGLTASFMVFFPSGSFELGTVQEENWAEAWKEYFTPVEGGEHFYVLAPWMEKERRETSRIPIVIEPKTAFGTGHHGSTSLCLDLISLLFSRKKLNAQSRFLDLGTGSGILAIACAKLGLNGDAFDNDPIAVDNALTNRELNNVPPEALTLACGDEHSPKGLYDVVIANILAGPLKEMAGHLVQHLKGSEGYLILSGILEHQAADVEAAYTALGLGKAEIFVKGEWAGLLFLPASQG